MTGVIIGFGKVRQKRMLQLRLSQLITDILRAGIKMPKKLNVFESKNERLT